ncbi:MED7 protein-domain-containing protein [Russula emetica]|nr:MED7 protein-domain-containing protein [Russula emetica]
MEDEQEAELRNPFPSPPSHYTNYTTHNLQLFSLLKELTEGQNASELTQTEILSDQKDVPEWPLTSLEKPRVDWIREEGYYNVFGDTWFLKETIPSLGEVGGHQLYPEDAAADRRVALLTILKSMFVTYSSFLGALLAPPPSATASNAPPEWHRQVEWITVLAQNIMAAANDLRPVQARASLELMMKRQLELRREETMTIHEKCDSLEAQLAQLRDMAKQNSVQPPSEQTGNSVPPTIDTTPFLLLPVDDVARWAEEL